MHTVKRVCTLVLTGLLALPMAAPAGAAAASFSDLPSSHWAYIAMTEAAGYGILQGTGANTMSPSAPLTWPQFLAMAARAFAPEEYARSAASGAAWDQAGLDAARSAGLLEGLDEAALTGAVTRQDAAVVLCNALPEEYTPSFWDQPIDPTALSNWGRMDSLRQEAVAELARRCVIQGKADGSFGYADPLQRCDGAVLLMRVLEQVDNSCRGESQTVTLHILNADTGEALLPDQQVETVAVLSLDLHFNVVLVHPERFCFSSSNRRRLEELAKLPLALQVNADTLLRWGTRRQGLELLELTATPLLGSDCHDMTKRPPNLKGGREMVRRKLGEAFLAQMDENARRLTAPTLAQV